MHRVGGLALLCTLLAMPSEPLRRIAFVTEFDGKVHTLDYATKDTRSLEVGKLHVKTLAYSHGTGMLAFEAVKRHDELASLYLLNIKDGKKHRIYAVRSDHPELIRPTFDPGSRYLYALNYFAGIFRYSLSQHIWEAVSVAGAGHINPQGLSFSRSGRKLAISPGDFKGLFIGKMVNREFVIESHVVTGFIALSPTWIGDDTIVFAGRKQAGPASLWKLKVATGDIGQLTFPPIATRDFLFLSADDKTIVFTGTDQSNADWKLWQILIDGTQLRQLSPSGSVSDCLSPVWIE